MSAKDPTLRALLGRSRELSELTASLDGAMAGRGSVFLLSGEAGIGKTRLAEELAREAQRRGASVFWGRSWEVDGASACWPWVQVLRACVQTEQGSAFLDDDPLGQHLQALVPGPRRGAPASDDPDLEALRTGSAIVALLERLSNVHPVVLVFDDLHASDLASLNLLQVVARAVHGLRVLVLGTYRELEARRIPKTSSLLAKLGRDGTIRPLGRLDRQAVVQWLEVFLGAAAPADLITAVFSTTEGNPLFVDALLQLLASRGGEASLPQGFALPDSIRETVHELLGRVGQETRDVLDAAAVLGRDCALPALQLVSRQPIDRVLAAVDEGIAAGILEGRAAPPRPVRFGHVVFREALYQALSISRRIELHAHAARALARLHTSDLDAHAAELAHHAFEGAPMGSWLEAADSSSRAGHRAMAMFAFDDAARHFERALTALDHAEARDDARRAELLRRLGLCQIRTGQTRAGREACQRAAALAEKVGRPDIYAEAALAAGLEPVAGLVDARLVELLESALRAGAGNEALRVQVMARLAAAMVPTVHRDVPLRLARESIAAARSLGDRRVLAEVLSTARSAFSTVDDLDERIALDRELAAIASALGDKLLELRAHGRLALDAIEEGSPDLARLELRIASELADETRVPQHRMRAACMHLLWATLSGNAEEIARTEADVLRLSESIDDTQASTVIEANRRMRAEVRGEPGANTFELVMNWNLGGALVLAQWLPPGAPMLESRHDPNVPQAYAEYAEAPVFVRLGPHMFGGMRALLTATCARLGEEQGVQALYDAMLPLERRTTLQMGRLVSLGPMAYHLGCLAACLGRPERAAAHFHEAIAICMHAGFTELEARTRRALEALCPAGEEDDAPEHERPRTPHRTSERALARVGGTIQRYRIERLLGVGGMGAVYAAVDPDGRRVAIKIVLEHFRDDPKMIRLFREEASAANHVGHPGAVPVLAHGVDDSGCAFLVMPLLEGETLHARWERSQRRLPTSEVAVWTADVLDVLASAHAKGIIHRDIKPENLFITSSGQACVLDFGIARRIDGDGSATIAGQMIGTPAFMPPEQALGNRDALGPHSDCWAVGATIFTLLSSDFVHAAQGAQAQLAAAATRHARSLRRVAPNLPASVIRFVDKSLAFNAADRWPSAREMREGLALAFESALGQPLAAIAAHVRTELAAEFARDIEVTLA